MHIKKLYPGIAEAEAERFKLPKDREEEPDYIAGKPNYDKFQKWDIEKILSWYNID